MHPFITVHITLFLCFMLVLAAINDLRVQKIPNLINFSVVAVSICFYTFTHGLDGLIFSVSGMLLGVALLIAPYIMGGMGAGDAKLMGAVGSVLGPKGVFVSFLYTAIVGGVYAVIQLIVHRYHGKAIVTNIYTGIKTLILTRQWMTTPAEPHEKSPRLCYGLAIALGTFAYLALERLGFSLFNGFRLF